MHRFGRSYIFEDPGGLSASCTLVVYPRGVSNRRSTPQLSTSPRNGEMMPRRAYPAWQLSALPLIAILCGLFSWSHPLLARPLQEAVIEEPARISVAVPDIDEEDASQEDANSDDIAISSPEKAAELQSKLIGGVRQLTFDGKRAGEGYFSADGRQMVFQSEREPGNPFFQIYLMDRETGDLRRVSPGIGKTTCAWIHPDGKRVVFASTQYDPEAEKKQKDELEFRASGETRRYSWDYDPMYELVEFNVEDQEYRKLTDAVGYDAEGSYSPDGSLICFASNRRAYSGELSEKEQELFDIDPASAMDLYIMNSDGSNVRQLTDTIGYDGGPFFSPDGKQICWRRFSENGATAEIMLMNIDGSNQRAITKLGAMSWAPYFHPTGDYLIFATNRHGFANFELYMVDAAGEKDPVRVSYREGFDGLPVFTPDGKSLVWTSNGGGSKSQLFEGTWDDAAARELLQLDSAGASVGGLADNAPPESEGVAAASEAARATSASFTPADIGRHVDYLCRPELGGRLTGTQGEKNATAYVAAYLDSLGLKPAGENGTFFHEFEFVSNVQLGPNNSLSEGDSEYEIDKDWRPVFFSQEGKVAPREIVFAGYGIVAPEEQNHEEYDSYVHLDVKDKWVMVFRQMPQDISPERRQHLARYSGSRYKAMVARDRGAAGLIFVSGPNSQIRSRLMPLSLDGSLSGTSLSVISVTDAVAEEWVEGSDKSLKELQTQYDSGDLQMGFELEGVKLGAEIDIDPVTSRGRNVLALLSAGDEPTEQMVLVGAHIDHLGNGEGGGSLAKDDEEGQVHRGADDNASGVAAVLEIAQYLANQVKDGRLKMKRDVLVAAWSGEELGLRGSAAFAEAFADLYPERMIMPAEGHSAHSAAANPHAVENLPPASHAADPHAEMALAVKPDGLYPELVACLNLDMVGRLRDSLVLQGIGSSDYWTGVIEQRNAVVRLPLTLQEDCNLPTDASTFFLKGVPILSAFTGSHPEYHTPRDIPEMLNYDGASDVAKLMALITRGLVTDDNPPNYQEQEAQPEMRANLTAYLGTVPDYAQGDIKGVKLSGVTKGAPAELGGMRAGDIIVELAGRKVENIYDYTYAIEALKIGQKTSAKVLRGDETIELEITPASRQ